MARSSADRAPRGRRAALAAALLLAGACAAPQAAGPLLLHPVPPSAERYALVQGAVVYEGEEITVSARPWDWRLVETEIRDAGATSPFGDEDGAAAKFIFIRVRFENHGAQTLVYNAMRSALVRPHEPPIPPLETSDLFAFAGEDAGVEARARTFARLCFDGTVSLRSGESVERYLVFRAPAAAKEVGLVLDEVWVGRASLDLRFPFEAFPGK